MTDTNTLAPTDAEIAAIADQHKASGHGTVWPHAFARAVLAKWGAPALASQPFAYVFSRSNGDGTHSEHIERGRLQEVAPGRWEHSGLPRGALADKPIKALYTTPQTQIEAVGAGGVSALVGASQGQPVGAAPVAWLRNLTDPRPHAVTSLSYRSAADSDAGVEYVPVYTTPQPAAQAMDAWGGERWLTVVYRDVAAGDEARQICEHPKASAMSWSHALNDRDAAIAAKQGGANG